MKAAYDRRKANRISLRVVAVVAVALVAYIAVQLATDPAQAGEEELSVRALFGFRVAYSDIRELRLEKEPIETGARVFGNSAFGLFLEGDFMVDGLGKTRVFLKKPNLSYVVVQTEDRSYAVSLGSAEKDQLLYDEIKLGMSRK
jgi:Bacterial PH domain